MVKNLKEQLEGLLNLLEVGDVEAAKKHTKVLIAWFQGQDDDKYLAKLMYDSMNDWSDIREGVINTSKLAKILRESGLIREDGE